MCTDQETIGLLLLPIFTITDVSSLALLENVFLVQCFKSQPFYSLPSYRSMFSKYFRLAYSFQDYSQYPLIVFQISSSNSKLILFFIVDYHVKLLFFFLFKNIFNLNLFFVWNCFMFKISFLSSVTICSSLFCY